MVVNCTSESVAIGRSSKPTKATSSGMQSPLSRTARIAPRAITSEAAKTASGFAKSNFFIAFPSKPNQMSDSDKGGVDIINIDVADIVGTEGTPGNNQWHFRVM